MTSPTDTLLPRIRLAMAAGARAARSRRRWQAAGRWSRRLWWIAAGAVLARVVGGQVSVAPVAAVELATQRVCVWGDSQDGVPVFRTIVAAMAAERPDYLAAVGDLIQHGGAYPQEWATQFLQPLGALAALPRVCVRGNHDDQLGFAAIAYPLPVRGGVGQWGAVSIGQVRWLLLDANEDTFALRTSMDPGGPQRAFIDAELASAEWRAARWRVAMWHQPAVTSLWYHQCYYQFYAQPQWVALMDRLAAAGCDLVLNGHAHGLQLGAWPTATSRMVWAVTGGGGGALDGPCTPLPMLPVAQAVHHYLVLELGAQLVVQARRADRSLVAEVRR